MQEALDSLGGAIENAADEFEVTVQGDLGGYGDADDSYWREVEDTVNDPIDDAANEADDLYSLLWNTIQNQLNLTTTEAEREAARQASYIAAGLDERQQKIAEGFFDLYGKPIELTDKTASELGAVWNEYQQRIDQSGRVVGDEGVGGAAVTPGKPVSEAGLGIKGFPDITAPFDWIPLVKFLKELLGKFSEGGMDAVLELVKSLLDPLQEVKKLDEGLTSLTQFDPNTDVSPLVDILQVIARVYGVFPLASIVAPPGAGTVYGAGMSQLLAQITARLYRPSLLSPGDTIQAARRGLYTPEQLKLTLEKQGFTDKDIFTLFQVSEQLIGIGELSALYLRGVISREELSTRLYKLGYDPEDGDKLVQLFQVIPGVNDLVRFAVREAWRDDIAERYGYDNEYPREFHEWGAKQGLSEYWTRKYWRAHWELPSPNMAYEMFQRSIISESELNDLLKIADYPDYWRERMVKVAYVPFTRVDIRRMHKLGILSRAEVVRAYQDIGYDSVKAEQMTLFTEALNAEEVKVEKQKEKDLTAAEILSGYELGLVSEEETRGYLQQLGYDEDESAYKTDLVDAKKLKAIALKRIEILKQNYVQHQIDVNGVVDALNRLGLTPLEVSYQVTLFELELEKEETAALKAAAKVKK